MAGVAGRSGKKLDSLWGDAIRRAIKRREESDPHALERLADVLLDKALTGDVPSLKEVGDRLDGKPAQQITVDGGETPLGVQIVSSKPVTAEEWAQQFKPKQG